MCPVGAQVDQLGCCFVPIYTAPTMSYRASPRVEGSLSISLDYLPVMVQRGQYFVYIMASRARVLYVGMTNDLLRRVFEHKNGLTPGFVTRYDFKSLVYFEEANNAVSAIAREKQLKRWRREKKLQLIESVNQSWMDLSADWFKS